MVTSKSGSNLTSFWCSDQNPSVSMEKALKPRPGCLYVWECNQKLYLDQKVFSSPLNSYIMGTHTSNLRGGRQGSTTCQCLKILLPLRWQSPKWPGFSRLRWLALCEMQACKVMRLNDLNLTSTYTCHIP